MRKIITIPECLFIEIKVGQKAIIDNVLKLLYFMFEEYPKNIYFTIKTQPSAMRMDCIEIIFDFEDTK